MARKRYTAKDRVGDDLAMASATVRHELHQIIAALRRAAQALAEIDIAIDGLRGLTLVAPHGRVRAA